jgi:biotin operon repressor
MTMMHAARIENSPRLQRVNAALADGQWHSTRDLMMAANVCAVNSCIAELRGNGIAIETRCAGRGRYEYRREQ